LAASLRNFAAAKGGGAAAARDDSAVKPVEPENVVNWTECTPEVQRPLRDLGVAAVADGKVAAVILSGGQGTRLGFAGPKGMYDMGLVSGKTIFQLHVERVAKIRALAEAASGRRPSVPIYVMTSDLNDTIIRDYFAREDYFNYPKEDIFFFEQGLEPCLTLDGKVIVESPTSLALAPDGNGGIYPALKASGAVDDMVRRGVEHLHIYGIDNVLTKALDPAFLGVCIDRRAQCGNKVVWRANKAEKVGVSTSVGGRMTVLEYSEIPAHLAEAEDAAGKLLFGAGNICNHYMSLAFLRDAVLPSMGASYHLATKKIPHLDVATGKTVTPTQVNGVKLEMFIFDVFPLAERWVVMEVARDDEFAPVKNEPGNPVDSPDTARAMLSDQGRRWLRAAGATVTGTGMCEVSPLLSYGGEGLEGYHGTTVELPTYLTVDSKDVSGGSNKRGRKE
jgi:UDP-N-acetylglucosamine/UDP-N-acetylgalactosamine diphosphorylase